MGRYNHVLADQALSEYRLIANKSVQQCVEDYKRGLGVGAYYQHLSRIKAAHKKYIDIVRGRT